MRTIRGVFQFKQHLLGGHRNTLTCQKVLEQVRKEIQDYMDLKKASKEAYDMSKRLPQSYFEEEDDDDDVLRCLRVESSQAVVQKVVLPCLEKNKRQKVHWTCSSLLILQML